MPNPKNITHIRPRFNLVVPISPHQLIERIKFKLATPPPSIIGHISKHHVTLDIIDQETHYWSPQMNFRVEEDDQNPDSSVVKGLIGPKPNVWTLFVFIYFSVGIISFFITLFALSKYFLGEYTLLLWAFPLGILFMLTAFRVGKYGEKLGSSQSDMLKDFLKEIIEIDTIS